MFHFDQHTKAYKEITENTPLDQLTRFFETNSSALVTERTESGELKVKHVITKVDLLKFLVGKA